MTVTSANMMTRADLVGLGMASLMGMFSFLGSITLLLYCIYTFFAKGFDPQPVTVMFVLFTTSAVQFIHEVIRFIYWIVTDLVQSLASIANLRWALEGTVQEGAYCRTQSAFEQIGDSGAAICVIVISILVFLRNTHPALITYNPRQTSITLVVAVTFVLMTIILVPATVLKHYYGDTGEWCWIVNRNGTTYRLQLGTEYGLMWAALGVETIVYVYLLVRAWCMPPSAYNKEAFRSALAMLWYAAAYGIEVIPMSVVRIRQFQHHHTPHGWVTFASLFFGAAGLVNALLFFGTGRRFGIHERADKKQTAGFKAELTEVASEGGTEV